MANFRSGTARLRERSASDRTLHNYQTSHWSMTTNSQFTKNRYTPASKHTLTHTHPLSQLLRAHISVREPRVISFVRCGGSIISIDQPIMVY